MKLVKTCTNHLLAHLYEHVYFIYLDTAFRSRGLFPIIDYSIDAFTEDGEITFDLESYSDINLTSLVGDTDAIFSAKKLFVEIALSQLESEHGRQVDTADIETLRKTLNELNEQPWNAELVFANEATLVTLGDSIPRIELCLVSRYPEIADQLKPLYRLVAGVTINTIVSDIADTFGAFVANEAFETDKTKDQIGRVYLVDDVREHEIKNLLEETKNELVANKGYDRLLESIRNIKTMTSPPSNERTYVDTGVRMDDESWRNIATQDNLAIVLEAVTYELTYAEIR